MSSTDLILAQPATLTPVQITPTHWQPRDDLTFDEWAAEGVRLGLFGRAAQWWLGDWVNYGERAYGEKYAQAIEATGLAYGTLANYAFVASRIEVSRRREIVSWSHHADLAALEAAEQDRWLTTAAEQGWNRQELRKELRAARGPSNRDVLGALKANAPDQPQQQALTPDCPCPDEKGWTQTLEHLERAVVLHGEAQKLRPISAADQLELAAACCRQAERQFDHLARKVRRAA